MAEKMLDCYQAMIMSFGFGFWSALVEVVEMRYDQISTKCI